MRIIVEFDETAVRAKEEHDFENMTPRDLGNFIGVVLAGAKAIRQPITVSIEESELFGGGDCHVRHCSWTARVT